MAISLSTPALRDGPPSSQCGTGRRPRRRAAALVAGVLGGLLVLSACGGSSDGPSAAPSSEPTTSSPSEPSPSGSATTGCTPTESQAPADVTLVQVVDVDGDGHPDKAWISGGADRAFGITTFSGATFSAPITSASPIPASGVVNLVGHDQTPIALVDVGREALLFTLADCAITQTHDTKGQPYVFDRGFGDHGTGVGCTLVDGELELAGLDAVEKDGGWTVTRTFIGLSDKGQTATNGDPEVVATAAAATDPVVKTAQEVSCGDVVAGADGLVEPEE